MSSPPSACVAALRAFAWPDPSRFGGLPACRLADLAQAFTVPEGGWRGSGYVGEDHRPLSWLNATGGGFPGPVRAWLDGDEVVMLDAEILGRPADLEALAAKLGEPAAKLDSYLAGVLLPGSEWVYPDRGLTLFVEPETHAPLRAAAWPRATLEDYRKHYRFMGGRRTR